MNAILETNTKAMLQIVERNVKVLLTTVKRLKPSERSFISTSILFDIF